MLNVLFLCTHNSARSQIAEGLLRATYGDRYEAYSAGVEATAVDPRAVRAMSEIGIDISGHRSKTLDDVSGIPFDLAVTLCDNAHAICPIVPHAKKTIHKGFADPHVTSGSEEDILDVYRSIRDEIAIWIDATFRAG